MFGSAVGAVGVARRVGAAVARRVGLPVGVADAVLVGLPDDEPAALPALPTVVPAVHPVRASSAVAASSGSRLRAAAGRSPSG